VSEHSEAPTLLHVITDVDYMEDLDTCSFTIVFSFYCRYLCSIESKVFQVILFTSYEGLPLEMVVRYTASGGGDCYF
jgi:hypothetical protein